MFTFATEGNNYLTTLPSISNWMSCTLISSTARSDNSKSLPIDDTQISYYTQVILSYSAPSSLVSWNTEVTTHLGGGVVSQLFLSLLESSLRNLRLTIAVGNECRQVLQALRWTTANNTTVYKLHGEIQKNQISYICHCM